MKNRTWSLFAAITSLLGVSLNATPVEDGLVVRFDAATVQTTVEQPPANPPKLVTSWPDRSGNDNHAEPVENVDIPRFTAGATPAGGGAVTFDGDIPQYLEVGPNSAFDGGQYTVYSVFRTAVMNQGRILNSAYLDGNPAEPGDQSNYAMWGMMPGPTSQMNFRFQTRSVSGTTFGFVAAGTPNNTVTANTFYIGGGYWDTTTGETTSIRVDGAGQRETGTASGANAIPTGHLFTRIGSGSSTVNANPAATFSGDIAELLVFNRVLSGTERQAVEDYLHARHFSGAGGQELTVTDNLILWLDADEAALEDPEPEEPKTRVTQWTDLSGRFNHAGQAPLEHDYPLLIEGVTPMGGDAVRFNGSNEFLEIPGNPMDFDGPERTWYVVLRPDALDNGRVINSGYGDIDPNPGNFQTNYAAWGSMPATNNRYRVQGRTTTGGFGAAEVSGIVTTDEFVIGGAMWDSNAAILTAIGVDATGERVIGTHSGADGIPTDHIFTRIGAGAGVETPNPNAYYSGDVAEILIYNRLLSEAEQLQVEEYLRQKHFGDLPTSGYTQWVEENFDPEDWENSEISGPQANPAGDGISNQLKYAMALSPWTDERSNLPSAVILEDALILTYRRAKNATDLDFIVEVSPDLASWQFGPEHVEELGATDEGDFHLVTEMALDYPGIFPRGFMRLRIEPIE